MRTTKGTRLISHLNGGLGNQLFQFAFAYSLSKEINCSLIFDNINGFLLDREYQRKYELGALIENITTIKHRDIFFWWTWKLLKKFKLIHGNGNNLLGTHIFEEYQKFNPDIMNQLKHDSDNYLYGYWQSYKYFEEYLEEIINKINLPEPKKEIFLSIADRIKNSESVAIGVRLYEETKNPSLHARNGECKSIKDINFAINEIQKKVKVEEFFVFSTVNTPIFKDLDLNENVTYVTHEAGYTGTIERLWLMSQCKHHLFTNSTYYWWGALLSYKNYNQSIVGVDRQIYCANNFINEDAILENWNTF